MAELTNLKIDGARLWDSLMEMAKIGATAKGGCNRLTLTDLDKQARELFAGWCEAAGCKMSVDRMGNMFARRAGAEESLPPVMIGSHLDTQPTGGKFDGVLGVLGGLEVLRTLKDLGIATRHPIEVVNWNNEEGSRFAPAMISSGVFAGLYEQDFAHALRYLDARLNCNSATFIHTQSQILSGASYADSARDSQGRLHRYFHRLLDGPP